MICGEKNLVLHPKSFTIISALCAVVLNFVEIVLSQLHNLRLINTKLWPEYVQKDNPGWSSDFNKAEVSQRFTIARNV
jgi:hypothetical protein